MQKTIVFLLLYILSVSLSAQWKPKSWPVLKHYDENHLYNIALPLGGIGTGTVSLGGRGELRDWQIMNKPAIGFSSVLKGNLAPFFAINIRDRQGSSITKALIGPLDPVEYSHYEGRPVNHHGLPRFQHASFDAAYPFGQVNLSDETLPVTVKIKAFNPFIPADANSSGIPIAIFSYEVTNEGSQPLSISICGSMRNFIGRDGSKIIRDWKGDYIPVGVKKNINIYKESASARGIYMYSDSVVKADAAWGTLALTTNAAEGISYRRSSRPNAWENALLDFWDDFSRDGALTDKNMLYDDDPMASLAVKKEVAAGETETFTFFISWNFPNRMAWEPFKFEQGSSVIGNYYSQKYSDAWDVLEKTIPQLTALEESTLQFVNSLLSSTYPDVIKEAALFNLATLRSQTVFRIPSGHLMGWEGIMDENGSCYGSCTHVWNYEQATPFLFGDLARTMRDVEFNYATNRETGEMKFRVSLPLEGSQTWWGAAADGQMGTIMKFYREWQLSGDTEFLKKNWPVVKKALSYAWRTGGWDANQDGVMEGSQHNTMDVDYYGPNPQMGFWYLGALKAASAMASFMDDKTFANKCDGLFKKGSAYIEQNLFNGEYYEHKITDPVTFQFLDMTDSTVKVPDFQLGKGCLVDQLVGQMMSHICGLGYLGDKQHFQTTLNSIMKYNYLPDVSNHFNNMRSYVMGNEAGLLMASWPKDRLAIPFPYFNESMTGFEYSAAIEMIYEDQPENALKIIDSIRKRYDGRKRNPFDEPECGRHYARSMTSWGALLAWSNFHYSAVNKSMSFTSRPGVYFWSNGYAWGTCKVEDTTATVTVLHGKLELRSFSLEGKKVKKFKNLILVTSDSFSISFSI